MIRCLESNAMTGIPPGIVDGHAGRSVVDGSDGGKRNGKKWSRGGEVLHP